MSSRLSRVKIVPRNDLMYQLGPPNGSRHPLILATFPLPMRRQMTSSSQGKRRPQRANATLEPPADIRGTSDEPTQRLRLSYGSSTIITGSRCLTAFFVAVVVSPLLQEFCLPFRLRGGPFTKSALSLRRTKVKRGGRCRRLYMGTDSKACPGRKI